MMYKAEVKAMTSRRNTVISWILFIVFSFVIFSSSCFIILHSEHSCTGEECSVCDELAECHKILNTLDTILICAFHLASVIFALFVILKSHVKTRSDHSTLISLKVELLN